MKNNKEVVVLRVGKDTKVGDLVKAIIGNLKNDGVVCLDSMGPVPNFICNKALIYAKEILSQERILLNFRPSWEVVKVNNPKENVDEKTALRWAVTRVDEAYKQQSNNNKVNEVLLDYSFTAKINLITLLSKNKHTKINYIKVMVTNNIPDIVLNNAIKNVFNYEMTCSGIYFSMARRQAGNYIISAWVNQDILLSSIREETKDNELTVDEAVKFKVDTLKKYGIEVFDIVRTGGSSN